MSDASAPPKQEMVDENFEEASFDVIEHCTICCARCSLLVCPCQLAGACQTILEYERGVLLRHGKQMHAGTLKGGLHLLLPCGVDELLKIDVREKLLDIPRQRILTKEGLTLAVDAVVYYRTFNAARALLSIEDVRRSIMMLSQTKLREILGTQTFDQIQEERVQLAIDLKRTLDEATDPWGVDVTRVEITDIALPAEMQRAMGSEAEAQRNAKAKVIEADGEKAAAETLKEAADIMASAQGTMQLRFLQTLTQISAEKNSTIIVPFPSELLSLINKT